MHYDFDDLEHQDHLAPQNIRPPMNFANGGPVASPMTSVMNTQTQLNALSRPVGSFSNMSTQLNANPSPTVQAQKQIYQGLPPYQPKSYSTDQLPKTPPVSPAPQSVQRMNPYDQGAQLAQKQPENFPAQPFQPQPTNQSLVPNQPQPQQIQVETQPQAPLQMGPRQEQPQQAPLAMAKGGYAGHAGAEKLIETISKKLSEQGFDFNKLMAMRLQHLGQKGDTMLAHINPEEAKMLKEHGGSGKTNPHTGLPSFGFDDGPEAGNTGSFSASRSAEAQSAREGDTAGSNSASMGSGSGNDDRSSRESYGGGRDNSDAAARAAQDRIAAELNAQRAAQNAADAAAAENAARIAAERQSMETYNNIMNTNPTALMSDPMRQALSNANAFNRMAVTNQDVRNAGLPQDQMQITGPRGVDPIAEAMRSPSYGTTPVTPAPVTPAPVITGFEAPIGKTTGFTPETSGIVPTGNFSKSTFDKVIDAITAESVAPTANIYNYTPPATPVAPQQNQPVAPTAAMAGLYGYTPPAQMTTVNPLSPAQIRAAQDKSMSNLVAAQANNKSAFTEYGGSAPVTANVPIPTPVPGRVPVDHPVPPEDIPPAAEETTQAPVPSPLSAKVPMPPIPYRDLGEGNIFDSLLKPFGLDTESWINNKAAEYEKQGMSPSDAAIQASYDLRDIQMDMNNRDNRGNGAKDTVPYIPPVTTPTTDTTTTTTTPPVVIPPYRTYLGIGNQDYSTYGLTGGERSFYDYPVTPAARGGIIKNLKRVK